MSLETSQFTAVEAGPAPLVAADGGPVLYTHTLCPYAERAWIALLEKVNASTIESCWPHLLRKHAHADGLPEKSQPRDKASPFPLQGVPFHLVHVDLSSKPSWYRSVNPGGLVPAVSYQGAVQVESLDICQWVSHGLPGPALHPIDPTDKQRMDAVIKAGSAAIDAGLDLMSGGGRYWGIGGGQTAAQKAAFESRLDAAVVMPLAQSGGPYLLGEKLSVADISLFPFVRRFDVGAKAFCGFDVRGACGGAVGRWLVVMEGRPSCRITAADDALLLQAYKKHRSLDFFDYDSYGIFALHPHNERYLVS